MKIVGEDNDKMKELKALQDWPNAKEYHNSVPINEIKIPDRIIFMRVPSGEVFFDCHPAEARFAIKYIKKARRLGINFEEKRKTDLCREAAIKSRKRKIEFQTANGSLTVKALNEMFVEIEKRNIIVCAMVLHPLRYADVRNWGQTIYDESTTEEVLTTGIFGHVWTADILVTTKCRKDTICLVGLDKKDRPYVKRFLISQEPIKEGELLLKESDQSVDVLVSMSGKSGKATCVLK